MVSVPTGSVDVARVATPAALKGESVSRFAYVNGRYLPRATASVSIEDRAFTFGDGVYEVCEVRGGLLIDETRHLARLRRSLGDG